MLPTRLGSLHLWFALQLHPELPIEFGALSTAVLAMPGNLRSRISFHGDESTSSVRILETTCLILHFISNSKTMFRSQNKSRWTRKWWCKWVIMFDVLDDQQVVKLYKSSKSFHPQIGPTASTQQTYSPRAENAASTEKGSRQHGIFLTSFWLPTCKERIENRIIGAMYILVLCFHGGLPLLCSLMKFIYNLHVFCNSDLQIHTCKPSRFILIPRLQDLLQ